MINAILILIALACLLWMAREIRCQWLEDDARREASKRMAIALAGRYCSGLTTRELAELAKERWQD